MIAGSAVFCYDANGNRTQKIDGSTTSYAYGTENRMIAVSGAAAFARGIIMRIRGWQANGGGRRKGLLGGMLLSGAFFII